MLKVNFDPKVIQENLTFVTNAAGNSNYATVSELIKSRDIQRNGHGGVSSVGASFRKKAY